ncbi:MAG: DEAD/DEAH box helicase [Cutibacterium avidum]|nr:DEAD/DEAH box helicase [Cutibacterium avidum]
MSEMLPPRQARELQQRLLDYLTTTFALADSDARAALSDFLEDPDEGLFKGPYLRTRLPFRPAPQHSADIPGWLPEGFKPYGHQAQAFSRLSSAQDRPMPTLVTTGTGSGKTEAFLYPILDHVLRARRNGVRGTKALILYPMNALATDQAARLARLISGAGLPEGHHNPLSSVTAAVYTGDQTHSRTIVSAEGLITDRQIIRSEAPDILLTNYKMLDQLLLRSADQQIWAQSAESLQYVVLDEFHTYDGAQGTDVAMLLRRLGTALKSHWPARGSAEDTHPEEDWQRPLGQATPVGTSATLGGGTAEGTAHMTAFATTIFGETFDADCVVPETRKTHEEWAGDAPQRVADLEWRPIEPTAATATKIHQSLAGEVDSSTICHTVITSLYEPLDPGATLPDVDPDDHDTLMLLVKAHPLIAQLVEITRVATHVNEIADRLFPNPSVTESPSGTGRAGFVLDLISALAHLRATPRGDDPGGSPDRDGISTETHLWVRELSRIDRRVSGVVAYRWSDDGELSPQLTDDATTAPQAWLPAVYCRHCGRSGWGVQLTPTGNQIDTDDASIRSNHATGKGRFRALLAATAAEAGASGPGRPGTHPRLMWFHPFERTMRPAASVANPDAADPLAVGPTLAEESDEVRVLALTGPQADEDSARDVCPSCGTSDAIRFMGSAIATMLSVTLSNLFGSDAVDSPEKKALIFTDSVQDAAHHAGFITARSHSITLRSALREGLTEGRLPLPKLADRIITNAKDDPFRRYRILPIELTANSQMEDFWTKRWSDVPVRLRHRAQKRLTFDIAMEFGLTSHFGRTLERTGSAHAHVDAGTAEDLANYGRTALREFSQDTLDEAFTELDDVVLARWVRGILERMRTQGSIEHPWLKKFIDGDGNRYWIWGGRAKGEGMPAFPRGRSTPTFPYTGGPSRNNADATRGSRTSKGSGSREMLLDPVTRQSWYATWTRKVLGTGGNISLAPAVAAQFVRALFGELTHSGVLTSHQTRQHRTAYALLPNRIMLTASTDSELDSGRCLLRCDVCSNLFPAAPSTTEVLGGGPCLSGDCTGTLHPERIDPDNSYRRLYESADMLRVNAREHTSLLNPKVRAAYEEQFKTDTTDDPAAPNVLVATPTLEMGIDIGDLSTVFLASLPRTVANYAQRVGRAGRLTGNSLDIAYITGRGEFLPRLGDPTSLINGEVEPPATYLSAEEILKRQYIAHIADSLARDDVDVHHPRTVRSALSSCEPGTFLGDLIDSAESHADEHLSAFLAGYLNHLSSEAEETLRQWATPPDTTHPRTSGLAATVTHAAVEWHRERDALGYQKRDIEQALPELLKRAEGPVATDEDREALRTAKAALRLISRQEDALDSQYWIGALERQGLLPNYTLLDDSVTLDVTMSWLEPDTGEYQHDEASYHRASSIALRDFAPGATFYSNGYAVRVDSVGLGRDGQDVRTLALCPECGYANDIDASGTRQAPQICPRCGSTDIGDTGQHLKVVEFTRASANNNRDSSRITDRDDERQRTTFIELLAADVDPAAVTSQWFVEDSQFGAKLLNQMTLRWFNLGKRRQTPTPLTIAGQEITTPLFRVCGTCGHLDETSQANTAAEHAPWCKYRESSDDNNISIALGRTLTTQGVVLPLPWRITTADKFAVPSLAAAVLMGLRRRFGGSPDHIGVASIIDPAPAGQQNLPALLLHDLVPGGTGYLAQLADPDKLWEVLYQAWTIVHDCPCQDENQLACHRCLLPYTPPSTRSAVSRSAAEHHLRTLLVGEEGGEPTREPSWRVTQSQATLDVDDESVLEQRFRKTFLDLAKDHGTLSEHPGPRGNVINLTKAGSPRRLTLSPQVSQGFTLPDFVLSGVGSAEVQIYTDGARYHASPKHNRVGEDAVKRTRLRHAGHKVLAVTMADCQAQNAMAESETPWFDQNRIGSLTAMFPFNRDAARALLDGPTAYLRYILQDMPAEPLHQFSRALPFGIIPTASRVQLPKVGQAGVDASLTTDQARQAALILMSQSQPTPSTTSQAWWWHRDQLGILVLVTGSQPLSARVCVVLDDRDPALDTFQDSWRQWLAPSNALIERDPADTDILTISAYDELAPLPSPTPTVELADTQWQSIAVELGGHHEELAALGEAGVPTEGMEIGLEVGGVPCDLAWPQHQVAVIFDPQDGDAEMVSGAGGWHLVASDPQEILTAMGGN